MPTENERKDVQKAMAYDLIRLFEKDPENTPQWGVLRGRRQSRRVPKELIDAYISGLSQ